MSYHVPKNFSKGPSINYVVSGGEGGGGAKIANFS